MVYIYICVCVYLYMFIYIYMVYIYIYIYIYGMYKEIYFKGLAHMIMEAETAWDL